MSGHPRNETERAAHVRAYVERVIGDELALLSHSTGGINIQLNKQAFAVWQLVDAAEREGVHIASENEICNRIWSATPEEYIRRDKTGAKRTIQSAREGARREPRDLSHVGRENTASQPRQAKPARPRKDEANAAAAKRIWSKAVPITSTIAETYLQARAIEIGDLPEGVLEDLRFHPECPIYIGAHGEPTYPALIARLRVAISGELVDAIHRTFLAPDGSGKATALAGKAIDKQQARKGLGVYGDGVVCFGRIEVGSEVLIAEGIEDALSGLAGKGDGTSIACLSQGRLDKVKLPSDCKRMFLGQRKSDKDREAWKKAAQHWYDLGDDTRIAWPGDYDDINELLRRQGPGAAAEALAEAEALRPDLSGLRSWDDEDHEAAANYVLKHHILRGQVGTLWSASGAGKTTLLLDFLGHVALDLETWHGVRIRGGLSSMWALRAPAA